MQDLFDLLFQILTVSPADTEVKFFVGNENYPPNPRKPFIHVAVESGPGHHDFSRVCRRHPEVPYTEHDQPLILKTQLACIVCHSFERACLLLTHLLGIVHQIIKCNPAV